jgi:hypothetical protein
MGKNSSTLIAEQQVYRETAFYLLAVLFQERLDYLYVMDLRSYLGLETIREARYEWLSYEWRKFFGYTAYCGYYPKGKKCIDVFLGITQPSLAQPDEKLNSSELKIKLAAHGYRGATIKIPQREERITYVQLLAAGAELPMELRLEPDARWKSPAAEAEPVKPAAAAQSAGLKESINPAADSVVGLAR